VEGEVVVLVDRHLEVRLVLVLAENVGLAVRAAVQGVSSGSTLDVAGCNLRAPAGFAALRAHLQMLYLNLGSESPISNLLLKRDCMLVESWRS
jgi:hypothetical protein